MDPKTFTQNAPGSLQRHPDGYWSYHPYALPPLFRWTDRLVAALSAADRAVADLAYQAARLPVAAGGLFARLEAAASCRLAGYALTVDEVLYDEAALRHLPERRSLPVRAALRLAETLIWVNVSPPTLDALNAAHESCWPGPYDPRWPPGAFRAGPTWVGSEAAGPAAAEFVPPLPEDMRASLAGLEDFILGDPEIPDLVRMAMIHYQLGVIHPYYDANGRMTRLLIPWLLSSWKLLPGPFCTISEAFARRSDEQRLLLRQVCRENAWLPWLMFFLESLEVQAKRDLARMVRLQEARSEMFARVEAERTAVRLKRVIDRLLGTPYITVHQVREELPGGNFKSAARVVDALVRSGILREVTGQARHRVFCCERVLACL